MKALYPGTFDPITFGHIDLIERAQRIFNPLYVGVVKQSSKPTLFTFEERLYLVKNSLKRLKNVKVEGFQGLVVEYARKKGIKILLRGLRMISDFEYELQMALTNRKLSPDLEILFFMPHPDYSYISSRLIKEAFFLGADISCFVPSCVIKALKAKKKAEFI